LLFPVRRSAPLPDLSGDFQSHAGIPPVILPDAAVRHALPPDIQSPACVLVPAKSWV
jgi:hypothetical protein